MPKGASKKDVLKSGAKSVLAPVQRRKLQQIYDHNPNPTLRISCRGQIVYGNPAGMELLDYSDGRIEGDLLGHIQAVTTEHEHVNADLRFGEKVYSLTFVPGGKGEFVDVYGVDITGLRQAQKVVNQQRDNFTNIFEAIQDGVYIVGQDYNIQYINPVLLKDFGPVEDRKCYKYFHDNESVCSWCKNDDVFAGKTVQWEWYSEKNGKTYDILDTPVKNPGGSISKLGIFRDITERKLAELELQEQSRLVQTILDRMPCIALLLRPWSREIVASNEMAKKVGAIPGEGRHCYDTWAQRTKPCSFCRAPFLWKTGEKQNLEVKHGGVIWDANWLPVSDDMYLYYAFDITERKRIETALLDSEQRYREVVEGTDDLITRVDNDGNFVYVNHTSEKIFGLSPDQCIGLSAFDFIHPDDLQRTIEAFESWIREETGSISFENRQVSRTGEVRDMLWTCNSVLDDSKNIVGIAGIARDITDLREAEKDRTRFMETLAEKTKEMERLLRIVAHDLRSPLVNIHGFSKELAVDCAEMVKIVSGLEMDEQSKKAIARLADESIPESINFIDTGVKRMDSLLTGLSKLAKVDRVEIKIQQIDMNSMIAEIIGSLSYQVKDIGASITCGDLCDCCGDETQINQVFANLLGNALKYVDPQRKGEVHVSSNLEGDRTVYCVEDNGAGIPGNHIAKVFELFHRVDPKNSASGDGLGLTTVKQILDRHKGRVWLESEVGKGSRFFVSLSNKK